MRMKITLESTHDIYSIQTEDGGSIEARLWKGKTEGGIEILAFITRIGTRTEGEQMELERELIARAPPVPVEFIPDMHGRS
jgi:hypothetical protein